MDRVVGIVPAGGKARRIHGFFKEMMPIGVNEIDKSRFIVSGEQIVEKLLSAGAASVHFILGGQKMFVAQYFSNQHLFEGRINFNFLAEEVEDLGMPYTIDSIFEQTKDMDIVMMGMPDTVVDPPNSFSFVRSLLESAKADLALGLYRTDGRNKGGFVQFDRGTKSVKSHIDQTSPHFPEDADNAWGIACWNKKFTHYMHSKLASRLSVETTRDLRRRGETVFGYLIDQAILERAIHVVADFVDEEKGFFWDITNPDKYFDLLRNRSRGNDIYRPMAAEAAASTMLLNTKAAKVFIGHGRSHCWHQLKDLLHDRLNLKWEEFNRVPIAGISTQERLREMVENACFAFLVMTAEEEAAGDIVRARDNVIHEVGLFQGKLGFQKAIILLEDGCAEFSNIVGLSQIRFPKGDILSKAEEIRRVLEREGVIKRTHDAE